MSLLPLVLLSGQNIFILYSDIEAQNNHEAFHDAHHYTHFLTVFSFVNSINVLSNYGTSFYLGFIRQSTSSPGQPRIIIGTNSTSNVNFAVKSHNTTLSLGGVSSFSATTVALSESWLTNDSSYAERNKGLHVSASAPIYVCSLITV